METDLPLVHVERGYGAEAGRGQITAVFGRHGSTLVKMRVPALHRDWVEVLRQSLEAANRMLETK